MLQADPISTARVLQSAGRIDEARRLYRRILETDANRLDALIELGTAEIAAGHLADADTLLTRAHAAAPQDSRLIGLHRQLGLALYYASFWAEALLWLERAAFLAAWDSEIAMALARCRPRDYLNTEIHDPLQQRTLKRYSPREAGSYVYTIDIVGTCNLRCPTCPVGNSPAAERPKGFMPVDLFERILEKISRESPCPDPEIWLYNWGEPLLHPDLPHLIRVVKAAGFSCHLSSNLNIRDGLEDVIRANPDSLKISLSGFLPETYNRTHRRGDVNLVKANMHLIRYWLDRHDASTRVWVGHHLYRSNIGERDRVAQLCRDLGFEHHPIEAFYMPLERLIDLAEGRENPADADIIADLFTDPRARVAARKAQGLGDFDCELRFNQTVINHDGTVALCCTVYEPQNMLGVAFLDEDFAQIEARKYRHPFCKTCYAHGLAYTAPVLHGSERV